MVSLGNLGTAPEQQVITDVTTFDWFGATIRLPLLEVSELELIDLMEKVTTTDENSPAAVVVVKNMFRQVIHVDDFDLFWDLAKQNRQKVETLMPVYQVLLEAATGRPTQQPSDSSSGRPGTSESSPTPSTPPVSRGRPDLQLLQQSGEETARQIAS